MTSHETQGAVSLRLSGPQRSFLRSRVTPGDLAHDFNTAQIKGVNVVKTPDELHTLQRKVRKGRNPKCVRCLSTVPQSLGWRDDCCSSRSSTVLLCQREKLTRCKTNQLHHITTVLCTFSLNKLCGLILARGNVPVWSVTHPRERGEVLACFHV